MNAVNREEQKSVSNEIWAQNRYNKNKTDLLSAISSLHR